MVDCKTMGWRGIGIAGVAATVACFFYLWLAMAGHANHVGFQSTSTIESNSDCLAVSPEHSPLPAQDDNDDSDETTDINDSDNGPDDLSADNSSRDDHSTPQLLIVDLGAMHACAPTIVRTATVAVHAFYCLHEHIRERAPPAAENQS